MNQDTRDRFDAILERVIDTLPERVRALLDHAPLVAEDEPDPQLLAELGVDPDQELLCGLHTGTPLTERSVTDGYEEPEMIHIFRRGVLEEARGWDNAEREIRITLLHEIGHHFGLSEEDLAELGYD